jgi:ankyrin repeat protein
MDDGIIPATTLEYWASLGNLTMVQRALEEQPDVNVKGLDDYTALHAAAENGHVEVMRFLLERGADVNARLVSGQTPLDFATGENAAILKEYGGRRGAEL